MTTEVATNTIRGERASQFAGALIDAKVQEARRSINKRGVRDIHTFEGDGFTSLTYERAAIRVDSWVTVSVLVERVSQQESTVAIFGGGGENRPFKLEEVTVTRILRGEHSYGESGRFGSVVRDIRDVCESLEVTIDGEFRSGPEPNVSETVSEKLSDS